MGDRRSRPPQVVDDRRSLWAGRTTVPTKNPRERPTADSDDAVMSAGGGFYQRYGFRQLSDDGLRLFLTTRELRKTFT